MRHNFPIRIAMMVFVLFLSPPVRSKDVLANKILVEKSKRTLQLLKDGKVLKTYSVALGREPVGAKEKKGDGKTPEGTFVVDWRNSQSLFHKSLHVSYPRHQDMTRAKALGVSPGGMIMIHGLPDSLAWLGALHRRTDWTEGCIAVTNDEMDEIWRTVPDGTEIEIRP